jgi:hypothetical protein
MPVEVYQNLPLITIVAPPEWGYVIVLPVPAPGGRVIFLASQLDRRDVSRELADFAVAHAFARVALGHGATTKAADARAADRLVKQWGYKIPVYRGRFRILVDGGL